MRRAGFSFAEAAGSSQSLELLFRLTPRNHQAIQFFVNAGFDEQRGFHKSGVTACRHAAIRRTDGRRPSATRGWMMALRRSSLARS